DQLDCIAASILGELPADDERALQTHLRSCSACRSLRGALETEEREIRTTFSQIASTARPTALAVRRRQPFFAHPIRWLSAAAAIVLVALIGWLALVASRPTIAYADVLRQLQNAPDVISIEDVNPDTGRGHRLWVNGQRSRCEDFDETGRV